jgi:hypothetical protein
VRHGIAAESDGSYTVSLQPEERILLSSLPRQVEPLLHTDDPVVRRVFPPAYEDDEHADTDYRQLLGSELVDGRVAALQLLEDTAHAERLSHEELDAWLGALETLRLVLGTQLDVTEESAGAFDPEDPAAPAMALYHWLSWLQDDVVQALSNGL